MTDAGSTNHSVHPSAASGREADAAPRVLIGGDWKFAIYEAALADGFRELGWDVVEFRQPDEVDHLGFAGAKLRFGPALRGLNHRFLTEVERTQPDLVFLQRGEMLLPHTLATVPQVSPGTLVFQFHNDDPWVNTKERFKCRHVVASLPYADATYVFRPVNVADAQRSGARVVDVLLPYYIPDLHFPVDERVIDFDIVFVGHYEDDGRAQVIEALAASGLSIGLFGQHWDEAPRECRWIHSRAISRADGDEYRRTLSRGRLALVLLSGLHRDVWTTRCFEIPAIGVAMLLPDNPYLRELYGEDEAVFYRMGDVDQLARTALEWTARPDDCARVAAAGRARCLRDGHTATDRARQIVAQWEQLRLQRAGGTPVSEDAE
jgi:spore maturation protein CgeB